MDRAELLRQLEAEHAQAVQSASFWRGQTPIQRDNPLYSTVEQSLRRAEATVSALQEALESLRNA